MDGGGRPRRELAAEFAASKLPMKTWFLALYLLTSTKTNMAAPELKRHLGVSYRTAWRIKHTTPWMEEVEPRRERRPKVMQALR